MTVVVAAVIAASIAAGLLAEPRLADGGRALRHGIARFLIWVTMPVIYFFVMARLDLSGDLGLGLLFAYLVITAVGVAAWLIGRHVLHLSRPATGALIVVVLLANTGYVGLPLIASTMDRAELTAGVAYDAIVSQPFFLVFSMGVAALFGRTRDGGRHGLSSIVKNPPLVAAIAGLLAPAALSPDVLVDLAHALIYVQVPLAFFMVGLTLGGEAEEGALSFPPAFTAPIATALGLRLVVAPALMLALSLLVVRVPDAFLLQAAMPCGANSVIVAHLYGLDQRLAASAVVWSTMIAVAAGVVAPLLL